MKTKTISISIEEIINLKADNENLKNIVDKLKADSSENRSYALSKTSENIILKREIEDLKLKHESLKSANRFNLGKCEAYETVIKQLIGGQ